MPLANHVIAQVVFQRTSGLPEDVVTNTFHFRRLAGAWGAQNAADAANACISFYKEPTITLGQPVTRFMNNTVSRNALAHEVRVYDGNAPVNARVPFVFPFGLDGIPATQGPYPAELACVLSFRGEPVNGVNPARSRGRIYFGPLTTDAGAIGLEDDVRVATGIQTALREAAVQNLRPDVLAPSSIQWVVFSQTGNIMTDVFLVSTDNAFDVQRRRGREAGSRTQELLA